MKTRFFCLFLLLAFAFQSPARHLPGLKSVLLKPFNRVILGLSGTVIDDDGRPLKGVFSIRNSWNSTYIPTRITFEGAFLSKWSAELSMAYSRLQAGKIINDNNVRRARDVNMYLFDLSAKYYPFSVGSKLLSPYGIIGLGYTNKKDIVPGHGLSINVGLGLSLWLYKGFGLNVQSMGKFALNAKASNYLMHTLGVVYRIVK